MQRVKELDSIRGLAALVIVVYHLWLPNVVILSFGVDLFFVLSGYLITSVILSNPHSDRFLVTFYARRCLRIWPIYYLTLAVLVLIRPYLPTPGNLDELRYYLTYTQEIVFYRPALTRSFPLPFCHTWTLAIEEQFYLLWPALLWISGERAIRRIAPVLIVLSVAGRALDFSPCLLITRCDGLVLGGLLASLIGDHNQARDLPWIARIRFAVFSLGMIAFMAGILALCRLWLGHWPGMFPGRLNRSLKLLGLNLIFFAAIGQIVLHAGHPLLGWLRDRRLVYLGTISYGIYPYHYFIFRIWEDYANHFGWRDGLPMDLAKLAVTLAVAALSWKFVERPILALKDRFRYRPATPPDIKVADKVTELSGLETG